MLSHSPTEVRNDVFDHIDVIFDEAIDAATFTVADVVITGPAGISPTATSIEQLGPDLFRVHFDPLSVRGTYQATIGPDVTDLTGDPMDQDGDSTPGEASDDTYGASFRYINAGVVFTTTTLISEGNLTFEGEDVLVEGTTVTIDGPHSFNSLHIIDGGVVTHTANSSTETHLLDLSVLEDITIDSSSMIDVSEKGYLRGASAGETGRTTGNTTVGGAFHSAGGSYGGLGGELIVEDQTNQVYGDYRDPDDWGSGGANNGGDGGGLVRINAGSVVLDGALMANGQDGHGGGGSGGGIYIATTTLSGSGSISAGGGDATRGGGGGRVAVYAEDLTGFNTSSISAPGGIGQDAHGGAGTVYLKDTDDPLGTLVLDAQAGGAGWTPLGLPSQSNVAITDDVVIRGANTNVRPEHVGMTLEITGSLRIEDSGQLREIDHSLLVHGPTQILTGGLLDTTGILTSNQILTVDGGTFVGGQLAAPQLTIVNAGLVTARDATTSDVYKLDLAIAGALMIDSSSVIDVSEKGYLRGASAGETGRTTGNTTVGGAFHSAGGSYGGLGGELIVEDQTNQVYGDYRDPDDWGSGGANNGGDGGGLVRINAGSVVLDGALMANGQDGHGGGGSGGGIYIATTTLSGSGSISAGGGDATRGGGGGRVAVYAEDLTGFNTSSISAPGGIGQDAHGGAGTVYLKDTDDPLGTLVLDAQAGGAGWTPLGLPSQSNVAITDDVVIRGANTNVRPEHVGMTLEITGSLRIEDSGQLREIDHSLLVHGPTQILTGGLLDTTGILTSNQILTVDGGTFVGGQLAAPQLTIVNAGLVTARDATTSDVYKLDLAIAGALMIDSSSVIDVSEKGYLRGASAGETGRTTGNTTVGGAFHSAGGSYGGLGGELIVEDQTNQVYGDYRDPDDWGQRRSE